MTDKTLREAAQMALDALETLCSEMGEQARVLINKNAINQGMAAHEALRAALAVPVAEPDQWSAEEIKELAKRGMMACECKICGCSAGAMPKPAEPVERQPLTDEQIDILFSKHHKRSEMFWVNNRQVARALEAHHDIQGAA